MSVSCFVDFINDWEPKPSGNPDSIKIVGVLTGITPTGNQNTFVRSKCRAPGCYGTVVDRKCGRCDRVGAGDFQYSAELQLQCLKDPSVVSRLYEPHKLLTHLFGDASVFDSISEERFEDKLSKYLEEIMVFKAVVQDRDGEPACYAYEGRRCMFRPLPAGMFDPDAPEPFQGGWPDKPITDAGQYFREALAKPVKTIEKAEEVVNGSESSKRKKQRKIE